MKRTIAKKRELAVFTRDIQTVDNGRKTHREVAKDLYGMGYRKFAEGAVVLTREEHAQMLRDLVTSNATAKESAHKATAQEILQELYDEIMSREGDSSADALAYYIEYILAKRHGVEVHK